MSFHRRKFRGYIPPELSTGSEEQGYVEQVARSIVGRGHIWRLVNPKGSGGTPGYPDELIFIPHRRILLAWDSKAGKDYSYPKTDFDPRGRLSPEQVAFGRLMAQGFTTAFGWGNREEIRRWFMALPGSSALEGLPLDSQGPIIEPRKED